MGEQPHHDWACESDWHEIISSAMHLQRQIAIEQASQPQGQVGHFLSSRPIARGIENRPPDNRHLPSHTVFAIVTSAAPDPLAGLPPRYLRTPEGARFLGLSGRALEKHRT